MVNKQIVNNPKKKKVKRLSANTYYPSAFISNPCEQLFGPSLNYSIDLDVSASDPNKSTNSLANESANNESTGSAIAPGHQDSPSSLNSLEAAVNQQPIVNIHHQPDLNFNHHHHHHNNNNNNSHHHHQQQQQQPQSLASSTSSIFTNSSNSNSSYATNDYAAADTAFESSTIYQPTSQQHQQQPSYESSIENSQNSYDFEYIPAPRWNKAQNSILEELFKKSRYPKPAELKSFAQRLHVMDTDVEVIAD